jgi:hypothetical protein
MLLLGVGNGLFASPNTSSIMSSVPARHRGAASGMRVTFANTGMPLSMGLFFTLLVLGLNSSVPHALATGLVAHGVPSTAAVRLSRTPPLGYLFAAFLGYNPLKSLLGPTVLSHLAPGQAATITSRAFFPQLIGSSFTHALAPILVFAAAMSAVAALASVLRGAKYVHEDEESLAQKALLGAGAGPAAGAGTARAGIDEVGAGRVEAAGTGAVPAPDDGRRTDPDGALEEVHGGASRRAHGRGRR